MKLKSINTDEHLIARLKARDLKAFEVIYDQHARAMMGVVTRIVRDPEESEKVLQDAFVKIWHMIPDYDSTKGRLLAWMISICRNTAIHFLQSKANLSPIQARNLEKSIHTEAFIYQLRENDKEGLRIKVRHLDRALKEVLIFVYYLGFTPEETAEKLNISLSTVQQRTQTALKQIDRLS